MIFRSVLDRFPLVFLLFFVVGKSFGQAEICNDGLDNNANGLIDCSEPSCQISSTLSYPSGTFCLNGANPTPTFSPSGGVFSASPVGLSIDPASGTINLAASLSGTYTVSYVISPTAANCGSTRTFGVNLPILLSAGINKTDVSCSNSTNGTAVAAISGGAAPYSLLWSTGQTALGISGLAPGSYCLTVTDANGCTASACATVNAPSPLTANPTITTDYNGQPIACFGGSNGGVNVFPGGGAGGYAYSWSNGSNLQSPGGLSSGNYCVTITDLNGCTVSACIALAQPQAVTAGAAVVSNPACLNACNASVASTPGGGTPGYSFQWSNGAATATVNGLCAGTYTVTITDLNGCTATGSAAPANPQALNITAFAQSPYNGQNVSCFGSTNGQIQTNVTGGTPAYSFTWSPSGAGANPSNLGAGTYTVTVADANNCTATASASLGQPTQLSATATVISNATCFGACNGSASVSASGGTPGYTYLWSNGSNGINATGLCAGTYSVTVFDANNCNVAVQNISIAQPAALTASATVLTNFNGASVSCFGGSNGVASANGLGGTLPYTFAWSNGSTGNPANNLSAGNFCVTVTDQNNCTASSCVTLNSPPQLSATAFVLSNTTCAGSCNGALGGSATGGIGPFGYAWSNGQSAATATGLCAGAFAVTATDLNGCTASATGTVNSPPALSITATPNAPFNGQNLSCFGASNGSISTSTSGGNGGYSFAWSPSGNGANPGNLPAGTYSVTVTDLAGCQATATATLVAPAQVIVTGNILSNVTCAGLCNGQISAVASGGTPGFTYQWNNGQTTTTLNGLCSGNFSVTAIDANGCSASAGGLAITQPTVLTVASTATSNYNGRNISCFGASDGSASASAVGGTAPYTFAWGNGATTGALSGLTAGQYCVTVTDVNGCSASSCVTLSEPALFSVTAQTNSSPLCFGSCTGAISATAVGGTPAYIYSWSNGSNTQSLSNLCANNYIVTATDANGCTASATTGVVQPDQLNLSASANIPYNGQNISCFGASNGSISTNLSGGTGPNFNFSWAPSGSGPNPTGLSAGTYTLTVTDANNCSITASATLSQPTQLSSTATVDAQPVCFGDCTGQISAAPAGGTSPYTFIWSNNGNAATNSGLCAGTYSLTVTDANGCTATVGNLAIAQPTAVTAAASVTSNYNGSQISCNGASDGSATVNAAGGVPGYTFEWSAAAQTAQSVNGLSSGVYTVTATDANACTASASVSIFAPQALIVDAGDNRIVTTGSFVSLGGAPTALGGTPPYSFQWSNGETTSNPVQGFPANGQFSFTVTVTDANGCSATDAIVVTVACTGTYLVSSYVENENCGLSDGHIVINVGTNNAGFSYAWSSGTPIVPIGNGLTNVSAGVYTVTITEQGTNCTFTETITVGTANAQFIAGIASSPSTCNQNNGTASVIVSPFVANPVFTWSVFAPNTSSISNLPAGIYSVTVSDGGGSCADVASVTVTEQPSFTLTASNITPASCNVNDGGAFISANGFFANPLSYTWSDNTNIGTNSRNNLPAGTVSVTVTDAIGCTAALTLNIPNASVPNSSVTIQSVNNESCPGANDGLINFSVVYSGTNFPLDTVISSSLEVLPNGSLSPGFYCVEIYDNSGCLVASDCENVLAARPLQITVDEISVSCFGLSNGSATAHVTGGTGNLSYVWDGNPGGSTVNGLTDGNHALLVSDVNGCTATGSFTILEPTVLAINITEDISLDCSGDCDGQISVTATGGTPDLTGAYQYQWSNGVTADVNGNICAGNYDLTVSDASGCTVNSSYLLGEPAPLQAGATGSSVPCFGDSSGVINLTAFGGTLPYSFVWSNGNITEDLSGLPTGTYSATVTDANGCSTTAQATVSQPLAITVILNSTNDVSCPGGENGAIDVTVTGGTPQYFYTWQGPTGLIYTNDDISDLMAGDYVLTVTDANGCQETFSQNLSEPDSLLIFEFPVNPSCNAVNGVPNGQITIIAAGGGGAPYSIQWTPNAGNSTDFTVLNLTWGSYGYEVTDSLGCTANGVIFLTQPDSIDYSFGNVIPVLCYGQATGRASITASGSNGFDFDFVWSSGEIGQDAFSNIAVQLVTGINTVTITENNTGCFAVAGIPIPGPLQPISLGNGAEIDNPDCVDGSDGSITVTPAGGTPPYNFQWLDASGNPIGAVVLAQPSSSLFNLEADIYGISITDANGCPGPLVNNLELIEPDTFLIDSIAVTNISCFGQNSGSATLVSTLSGTPTIVAWSNGLFGTTVDNLGSGNYSVTVTSTLGCVDSADFSISQPDTSLSGLTAQGDTVRCYGESNGTIRLDTASVEGGVGPYLFSLDGVVFSDIDSFTGLSAGYYTVYVQDLFGCSDTAEVYIAEPEPIEIATVPNYARINLGETVEARVQLYFTPTFPPITYTWTPTDSIDCDTCSSVVLNPIEDTRYIVTVRDSNGCFDTAHVYVNVDPQRNLFIPTAFTPNGDGLNDVFMVYGSAGVREVLNFQIYDRWGEQLFTAANFPPTDPAFGWNGQYKGKVLNPGTFVYYIEVEFIDGKIRKYQGDVTIIR